jgi:magnesium transporter
MPQTRVSPAPRRSAERVGLPYRGARQIHLPASRAVVDCGVYVHGRRLPGTYTPAAALDKVRELDQGFVWVGLHAPNEQQIQEMATVFGLHPLAVKAVAHPHQRPKLESYDDTVLLVLKTVHYVPHDSIAQAHEIVATGEIMSFAGPNFVVTVRLGEFTGLASVRKEMDTHPDQLRLGPFAVMYAIADHVVDSYLDVTLRMETDIDAMEEEIFGPRSKAEIGHIYFLKRELVELRRAVSPLSAALQRLVADDEDLICTEVKRYMRDVLDHQDRAADRIASYDEVLTSLVQVALARVVIQQNADLRRISAWVAIASIPTMLAAIYGMNFEHMPELGWTWGYPSVLTIMACTCLFLYRRLRRNHWL